MIFITKLARVEDLLGLDILTQITCGELKKSWLLKESANETEKPSYATPERSITTVQLTA